MKSVARTIAPHYLTLTMIPLQEIMRSTVKKKTPIITVRTVGKKEETQRPNLHFRLPLCDNQAHYYLTYLYMDSRACGGGVGKFVAVGGVTPNYYFY